MRLAKRKSNDGKEVIISLPEKFDFQLHKEFKEAYEASGVKTLTLDMNKTRFMDSSALGMLLQLKEYGEKHNTNINISNANNNVMKILSIAHFDKLFKVA